MVTSQEAGTFIHSGRTGNKWSDHMRSQKSWYLIWSAWTHSELSWQVGNLYIVLKNEESSTDRTGLRAALMKCSDAFNKKMWERKQMVEQRQRYSRKLKLYFLFLFFFPVRVVQVVRSHFWTTLMVTLSSVALVASLHLGEPWVLT